MTDEAPRPGRHRWTKQDHEELAEIVNERRADLTKYVRKIAPGADHDNVIGEALVTLYVNWDSISGHKLNWLYRTARNKAIDAIRDKNNRNVSLEHAAETQHVGQPASWMPPAPGELLMIIEASGRLPHYLGLVLTMKGKGWTLDEIAEYTGNSVDTVRTYLARAYKQLSYEVRSSGDPELHRPGRKKR
ncbi:RNA polymerase sigma factor [Amycolatopsis lurida]|uniref:RNA polymerase sigma factor n=1 Tax=Amycolatopsis sp. YIM 10 TaxID=2653857 RepID=UPI00128FEA3B|nr:sigma-70 family RNA polymerase sigma factor [Amycolatopsis sp. YIM 10]QFU86670.1 RNA polymerase sigma factor [Amycolatopsis sp. YIM 10]